MDIDIFHYCSHVLHYCMQTSIHSIFDPWIWSCEGIKIKLYNVTINKHLN